MYICIYVYMYICIYVYIYRSHTWIMHHVLKDQRHCGTTSHVCSGFGTISTACVAGLHFLGGMASSLVDGGY